MMPFGGVIHGSNPCAVAIRRALGLLMAGHPTETECGRFLLRGGSNALSKPKARPTGWLFADR